MSKLKRSASTPVFDWHRYHHVGTSKSFQFQNRMGDLGSGDLQQEFGACPRPSDVEFANLGSELPRKLVHGPCLLGSPEPRIVYKFDIAVGGQAPHSCSPLPRSSILF